MTRQDHGLRYFAPMREVSHALAERLPHLDYDREMALTAIFDLSAPGDRQGVGGESPLR
jgi:acetyltransferase